ncbi:MAG: hypothetical protein ACI8V4_002802, partial [Ilumatobacter sp.]
MSSTVDSESLRYNCDELMVTHDYATSHVVAGRTLHGGFLGDGSYMPPRATRTSASAGC